MRVWTSPVLAAGVIFVASHLPSQARPMYAAREGKGCSHCHVRPAGGQELNTAGQFYKSHAFSFKGFTAGRAPAAAKLVIAPGKKPAAAKALGKAKKQAAAPKPRNRR